MLQKHPVTRALHVLLALSIVPLVSCDRPSPPSEVARAQPPVAPPSLPEGVRGTSPAAHASRFGDFRSYWYQGLAELSRFELSQMRYGDAHDGEAVLVFVTEDFHADTQVKYEGGPREGVLSVLKLNAHRRFYTGIYPYSVLTSVFVPATDPGELPLKVTSSVQEWCGHAYVQLNRRDEGLRLRSHSYFQDEGDQDRTLPTAVLEDQLMVTIRRDPSSLPVGEVTMVPGMVFLRFEHLDTAPAAAIAERATVRDPRFEREVARYSVRYPGLGRELRVLYDPEFPHEILAFEERQRRGGQTEITTATRTHALVTDYWTHHGAGDGAYREALGLTE